MALRARNDPSLPRLRTVVPAANTENAAPSTGIAGPACAGAATSAVVQSSAAKVEALHGSVQYRSLSGRSRVKTSPDRRHEGRLVGHHHAEPMPRAITHRHDRPHGRHMRAARQHPVEFRHDAQAPRQRQRAPLAVILRHRQTRARLRLDRAARKLHAVMHAPLEGPVPHLRQICVQAHFGTRPQNISRP
jgi:hypothetical protein